MRTRKPLIVLVASAALLLGPVAGVASAHVSVSSDDASAGGYATVTFRVPTEKDVATTKVEVAMPTNTPIASVRAEPKPGWDVTVTKAAPSQPLSDDDGAVTEVVSRIAWTATGDGIPTDQFDRFTISAGPLPDASQVVFKVLQTYADGSVVSWIEENTPGAPEPEFPAPVLTLAAGGDAAAAPSGAQASVSASTDAGASPAGAGTTTLAVVALVASLLALLGVGYLVVVARRPTPATPAAAATEPETVGAAQR